MGNGDPSLAMYGAAITPNEHKLALQFGVLDNFLTPARFQATGMCGPRPASARIIWKRPGSRTIAASSGPTTLRESSPTVYPLLQKIPDVNEPASGYLWGNLAAHGKTYYHFGEYISSTFCDQIPLPIRSWARCSPGPNARARRLRRASSLPAEWGGGVNKWPWAIPLIATNVATKPELVGHFAPEAPDFNLLIPDQIRVEIFLRHLKQWVADRESGNDTMPNFVMLRLPNDHTYGTRPGGPSPKSSVADNDLAVGRAVEAISHSPYWDDTAFFILEDDAQTRRRPRGCAPQHCAGHQQIFAARRRAAAPFVDSRFYSTVSVVRTMEALLGLPPMNNNDAFCSMIAPLFTGPGDQPPYAADYSNRDNGLIYTANPKNAAGARASMKMDFSHEDRAPTEKLNVILWKDAMGTAPVPAMLKVARRRPSDGDDD